MTVISNVKGTIAKMRGVQAEFSHFAQITQDRKASAIFHECMEEAETIINDLEKRVEFMKAEELQYRKS